MELIKLKLCLVKIKILLKGNHILFRIIVSSVIAITLDTVIFVIIAYGFVIPTEEFIKFVIQVYFTKMAFEIALYPLVRSICNKLKRSEGIDVFDINTKFTPFSLDVDYNDSNNFWKQGRKK